MILYTPLSMDDIFPEDEQEYEKHKWIEVNGSLLKVYDMQDGTHMVTQFLSTNPNDYLNSPFTPGTRVKI